MTLLQCTLFCCVHRTQHFEYMFLLRLFKIKLNYLIITDVTIFLIIELNNLQSINQLTFIYAGEIIQRESNKTQWRWI